MEDLEMLNAINRLYVMFERGIRTSVGHPESRVRERDFRHALADFVVSLGLDPDTTDMLHHEAMNPRVPKGDAIWDD